MKYASLLSYCSRCPKNYSEESDYARMLMRSIKNDWPVPKRGTDQAAQPLASQYVASVAASSDFDLSEFLGPRVALVPIPKSSPMTPGQLWVPMRLARELERNGLGRVIDLLERVKPVSASHLATAAAGRPPPSEHFNSLRLKPSLLSPDSFDRITLVDDLITRGSTMFGCQLRLRELFPGAKIVGFAAMRTISDPDEFRKALDPVVGEISVLWDIPVREPRALARYLV